MTVSRCADLTFGINPQALAILQLLAGTEPAFADFDPQTRTFDVLTQTYPWYNGLEKGVALVVQKTALGPCAVIVFGENRSSDHVFVEHWMLDRAPENGPTLENAEVEGDGRFGIKRALFKHGRFDEVVTYILDVMGEFYERASAPRLAVVRPDPYQGVRL